MGAKRVMELRATLPETTVAKLDRLLKIIQGLSFEELVGGRLQSVPGIQEKQSVQIQFMTLVVGVRCADGVAMGGLIALLCSEGLVYAPELPESVI